MILIISFCRIKFQFHFNNISVIICLLILAVISVSPSISLLPTCPMQTSPLMLFVQAQGWATTGLRAGNKRTNRPPCPRAAPRHQRQWTCSVRCPNKWRHCQMEQKS